MADFVYEIFLSYPYSSLAWRKILWHGADGVTSPPQEGVLRIFIALKKKSIALARYEPSNLGSNSKHDNQYTTEATCGLDQSTTKLGETVGLV
jgi:hypothetical protein